MDYFQYYFQHSYLRQRCQSEACFACNSLVAKHSFEALRDARAGTPDDLCYKLVGESRMQLAWRRCWEILGALQRQLPAVANAQTHEVAVAWHARKDPRPRDGVPVIPDVQNQAGFVVCRRLGCC